MGIEVVAGIRLETRWIGQARSGQTVLVFLHEGLGCMAQWRDFPDRVAASLDLPALVYSRAGYGASDPVEWPRPLDYLNREGETHLPALLDHFGLERVVLIGHSDGATIALIAAGDDGKRIAAGDDGERMAAGSDRDGRVLGAVAMAPHSFVEDLCLEAIAKVTHIYRTTDLRDKLARYHGDNVDCAFWGWNATWLEPGFKHWHIRDHLAAIRAPVLVIQGASDEYASLEQVEIIRRTVPAGVRTLVLPQCGHTPQRDQAQAVFDAIVGFVRELGPVSA
ncbi:MAG: putative hydrolase or acyltransferase [Rhodospirillaceae bacterium]|nr:MAG: putative hydrolase or acyltransferase [Rhodospirillaceae bacterium]TNC93359.1 MAG: putative hydrolase or acyltransferase (Alpha/beta hydrolase superfamily) [Stygiobacter sp.]